MNRYYIFFMICFILIIPYPGETKENRYHFGEIKATDGHIVINFELRKLFSAELLDGLKKGITAGIEYKVQLWKDRSRWFDQMLIEKTYRMKVSFKSWDKRYTVVTGNGQTVSLNEDRFCQKCSCLDDFQIIEVKKLNPETKYYIAIKVVISPISVENYQEIKQWLTGEVKKLKSNPAKSSESSGKKAGDWLLNLVLNLTGFGDQTITARSSVFLWKNSMAVYNK